MNDCGKIAILLATYNPNIGWLTAQLQSLNAQSYSHLTLYVCDDCSTTITLRELEEIIKNNVTAFPFTLFRNEKNVGSNKTFEFLTEKAEGDFFAYCDQDDVWLPEKLEKLIGIMQDENVTLACSDVIPIDAEGKKLADSIIELRPRQQFLSGEGLASGLIYKNFVSGCTLLIRSDIAKLALPFATYLVHDHYLAIFSAMRGKIAVSDTPLIKYRLHGSNQTGVLTNIQTKQDYFDLHVMAFYNRVIELKKLFDLPELDNALDWANARIDNFNKKRGCVKKLYSLRKVNKKTTMFEIIILRCPNWVFKAVLSKIQKGKL